jgi:hydrogenase/urease accessory protein HupE
MKPFRLLVLIFLLAVAGESAAHEVRPGYLEMEESAPGMWNVLWKVPMSGNMRLALYVVFPEHCEEAAPVSSYQASASLIQRWAIRCEDGLVGHGIGIDGLSKTLTDVLVRVQQMDGVTQVVRLKPSEPYFTVSAAPTKTEVAGTYFVLGVEHILSGVDHLLFVLALLIIVKGWKRLVTTVTAFTVAHSITLAAATLGFVHVPGAPVEAVIALSILFLATEIVHGRQGKSGLTEQWPWIVAFTFGLLHGFGFASALSQIGLPQNSIPLALFFFNVGVEAGQLLFIAGVFVVWTIIKRLNIKWPDWAWTVPAYGIGAVAAYWTIERVAGFWV